MRLAKKWRLRSRTRSRGLFNLYLKYHFIPLYCKLRKGRAVALRADEHVVRCPISLSVPRLRPLRSLSLSFAAHRSFSCEARSACSACHAARLASKAASSAYCLPMELRCGSDCNFAGSNGTTVAWSMPGEACGRTGALMPHTQGPCPLHCFRFLLFLVYMGVTGHCQGFLLTACG